MAVEFSLLSLHGRHGRHALRVELVIGMVVMVMVRAGRRREVQAVRTTAVRALRLRSHSKHAGLGRSEQSAHAVEQELPETLRLSAALFPGDAVGGRFFDLSLGDVQLAAARVMEKSQSHRIQGDGATVEIEDSEAHSDQIHRVLRRSGQRHFLHSISQRNGFRLYAIRRPALNGSDESGRWRREDLATVSQKEAIFSGEVDQQRGLETVSPADLPILTDFTERTFGAGKLNLFLLGSINLQRVEGREVTLRGDGFFDFGDNKEGVGAESENAPHKARTEVHGGRGGSKPGTDKTGEEAL
jgi:hypothetical protein